MLLAESDVGNSAGYGVCWQTCFSVKGCLSNCKPASEEIPKHSVLNVRMRKECIRRVGCTREL